MQGIPASVQGTVNSIHRELKTKYKPSIQVGGKASAAKRKSQAATSLPDEIATKKLPGVIREKGESGRTSEPILDRGFGNLLPTATKSKKRASVSY
jgi:hypothetical protein